MDIIHSGIIKTTTANIIVHAIERKKTIVVASLIGFFISLQNVFGPDKKQLLF